ncbi:hypothetical protein INR49_013727, partial [Caranx melampygus]
MMGWRNPKTQPHFVGQSVQQEHCLPPGCINLIPLHRDTGESTQAEIVDGTKLAAVPGQEKKQFRFPSVKLNLAVTHLVVNALQLIIQLELLPFKLAVLLLLLRVALALGQFLGHSRPLLLHSLQLLDQGLLLFLELLQLCQQGLLLLHLQ